MKLDIVVKELSNGLSSILKIKNFVVLIPFFLLILL